MLQTTAEVRQDFFPTILGLPGAQNQPRTDARSAVPAGVAKH